MNVFSEYKGVNNLLARAAETKPKEPLISYFCRLYAAQKALQLERTPQLEKAIHQLLIELEKEKVELATTYASILNSDDASYNYLIKFAFKVFLTADNEDRKGISTLKTAKVFLASVTFMETLSLFTKSLDIEIEEKIKYAKWKAADITRSIKSGNVSLSEPPKSSHDEEGFVHAEEDIQHVEAPESANLSSNVFSQDFAFSGHTRDDNRASEHHKATSIDTRRLHALDEAQKNAKYAASALQFEDVESAKKFLLKALEQVNSLQ